MPLKNEEEVDKVEHNASFSKYMKMGGYNLKKTDEDEGR